MNMFEQKMQEMEADKSPQEIVAMMLMENVRISPEKRIVFDLIREFVKLTNVANVAAHIFAFAAPHDKDPEVYKLRGEVLEYIRLVNYGLNEFFANIEIPEVLQNGDQ